MGSHESYSLSLELIRNGLVCGPSSGFNLQGLYQLIEKRKAEGTLGCDLPYQYVNEYFEKLGDEHFAPINNQVGVLPAAARDSND